MQIVLGAVRVMDQLRSSPRNSSIYTNLNSAIDKLIKSKLIDSNSVINLFNKGEPTLHPNFLEILKILHDNDLMFTVSTNSSKFIEIPEQIQKKMQFLIISMPGFSQKSYDRIHGFSFKEIIKNTEMWIKNYNPNKIKLNFHIYQFNLDEINLAKKFCEEKGIEFFSEFAWFIDFKLSIAYLNGTIDKKILHKASKDLFFYYIDDLIAQCPLNYQCPEFDNLVIDEYCNVLTCCGVLKNCHNYSIGSLFSLSKEEIEQKKKNQDVCIDCLRLGRSYWVHHPFSPF